MNPNPTPSQPESEPNPEPNIPPPSLQTLHRWITCLALVTFDLDQGQKVQCMVPDVQFSEQSVREIAMLSFPDSNSFNDYENSVKYAFRMFNGVYGYSCFKQKKDPNIPRGFSQRSFVVLSELPFVHFFQKLAEFIVFKTFNSVSDEKFPQIMTKICEQISRWPDPTPKSEYILPILQYQLSIQIPNYKYSKQSPIPIRSPQASQKTQSPSKQPPPTLTQSLSPTTPTLPFSFLPKPKPKQLSLQSILSQEQLLRQGPFQQVKICQNFINCYEILWAIWEKVMLNQSIMLLGSNPQQVSHAVLGGISMIYPFQYCGYFNPYVTVYDPNLQKTTSQPKNYIIGATNPLIPKLLPKHTTIIPLSPTYKPPKHLLPTPQLFLPSTTEQQQAINESVARKYFHHLSRSVMAVLDAYLEQQVNDLKFFNEGEFMKWLRERKEFGAVEQVFAGRKSVLGFFQGFVRSGNFLGFLGGRNVVVNKGK